MMDGGHGPQPCQIAAGIGSRIQLRRGSLGMSQERLALELGVSRQTVSNWECGRTTPDAVMLARVATCLDTTAGDILGEEAPFVRDRARATRRELVTVGGILFALQSCSGFAGGMQVAGVPAADLSPYGAFSFGVMLVTLAWLASIMRRTGLLSVRSLARFASLASGRAGGAADRAIRMVSRWFWTTYFGLYVLAAGCGKLFAVFREDPDAAVLLTDLLMVGVVVIIWSQERYRNSR